MNDALIKLRGEIDRIDDAIVDLLNRRARLAQQVGDVKKSNQHPLYSPDRERNVLERLRKINQGPMPGLSIDKIYREIMASALALEDAPFYLATGMPENMVREIAAILSGSSSRYEMAEDLPGMLKQAAKQAHAVFLVSANVAGDWISLAAEQRVGIRWTGSLQVPEPASGTGMVHLFSPSSTEAGCGRPAKAFMVPGKPESAAAEAAWIAGLPIAFAERMPSGIMMIQFRIPSAELNRTCGPALSRCPSSFFLID